MTEAQVLMLSGAAVIGMVMGACLDLSAMGAVRAGAMAMAFVLSTVTRTIGDKDDDGPEWDR